jgi:hypothetical protein
MAEDGFCTCRAQAREIEHLRGLLSQAEHFRDGAEKDARELREALREFAALGRGAKEMGATAVLVEIVGGKVGFTATNMLEDLARAAELVPE